jgi:hypothetical protein
MDPAERIGSNTVERTHKDKAYRLEHVLVGISRKDDPRIPSLGQSTFGVRSSATKQWTFGTEGLSALSRFITVL